MYFGVVPLQTIFALVLAVIVNQRFLKGGVFPHGVLFSIHHFVCCDFTDLYVPFSPTMV
jgi:hypothetical protein